MHLPVALLLHAGGAHRARPSSPCTPSTVIGLAALGALYHWRARASARGAVARAPRPPGQRATFLSALALIFFSLNGWLHDLSDYYLFSAHMVQHLVLTLVAPPLLIMGTPGWMLRPALALAGRRPPSRAG